MSRVTATLRSPVEGVLRYAVAIGATLVLLIPAARGDSAVGWLPLWLLGMPLCAWACLRLVARLDAAVSVATPVSVSRPRPAAIRRLPAARRVGRRGGIPVARRRDARAA